MRIFVTILLQLLLLCCGTEKSAKVESESRANTVESVHVSSWNVGLCRHKIPKSTIPVDLVPCVRSRTPHIVQTIQNEFSSPEPRILFLQEVWYQEAFERLQNLTKTLGDGKLQVIPPHFDEVDKRGLVIITNLEVNSWHFHAFRYDLNGMRRGILEARIQGPNGRDFVIANTHTAFSKSTFPHPVHVSQLDEISKWLNKNEAHPAIIGGDFNAGPNLEFRNQNWDPVAELWNRSFVDKWPKTSWKIVEGTDGPLITWDSGNNTLITHPTWFVKIYHALFSLKFAWEVQKSTLDHILVNSQLTPLPGELSFHQKLPVQDCFISKALGQIPLSDHYGLKTIVKF